MIREKEKRAQDGIRGQKLEVKEEKASLRESEENALAKRQTENQESIESIQKRAKGRRRKKYEGSTILVRLVPDFKKYEHQIKIRCI